MNKFGAKAQNKVAKNLHEHKHEGKFQSRKQAIAVGLNQARREGGKVPKKEE